MSASDVVGGPATATCLRVPAASAGAAEGCRAAECFSVSQTDREKGERERRRAARRSSHGSAPN